MKKARAFRENGQTVFDITSPEGVMSSAQPKTKTRVNNHGSLRLTERGRVAVASGTAAAVLGTLLAGMMIAGHEGAPEQEKDAPIVCVPNPDAGTSKYTVGEGEGFDDVITNSQMQGLPHTGNFKNDPCYPAELKAVESQARDGTLQEGQVLIVPNQFIEKK